MYKSNLFYRPWLKDLAYMMMGLFAATLLMILSIRVHQPWLLILALFSAAWAWRHYHSYNTRIFGKRVERQAQRALNRAFRWNKTRVKLNSRCPTGGDIDAVLSTPNATVAIEIKSWIGLRIKQGELVKLNGQHLHKNPVKQALRQAGSINGRALLWMPRAKRRRAFVYEGVLVIMGDVRYLKRVIKQSLGAL